MLKKGDAVSPEVVRMEMDTAAEQGQGAPSFIARVAVEAIPVAVETGFTTQNEVEILSGLAAGDLIEAMAPPRAPAGG